MIQRITDIIESRELVDSLLVLGKSHPDWLTVTGLDGNEYVTNINTRLPTLVEYVRESGDTAGIISFGCVSRWLVNGPKLIRPTLEQAESLSQVEVPLRLDDYSQPFPVVFVELPRGIPSQAKFKGIFCWLYSPQILILHLVSHGHQDDIVTMIRTREGFTIEDSIHTVEDGLDQLLPLTLTAQRVAINMCLTMTNVGTITQPLFPKDRAMDQQYAKEDSERGRKARKRLETAIDRVDFCHEVIVRRTPPRREGESTGKTVAAHWVRGHWKMQIHGPGGSLRKRILIRPYLVHAEQAMGQQLPGVVYKDKR